MRHYSGGVDSRPLAGLTTKQGKDKMKNTKIERLKNISIYCHRTKENRIMMDAKGIPAFFNFIGNKSPIKCYDYKFDRVPMWRFSSKRMSEVAEEIGVSYGRLSYLVKQGEIECYRASKNGRPRLLPEHVEQAIELIDEGLLYWVYNERERNQNETRKYYRKGGFRGAWYH